VAVADILPAVTELPEGIPRGEFQARFGGLGGAETQRLLEEINRRITALGIYE